VTAQALILAASAGFLFAAAAVSLFCLARARSLLHTHPEPSIASEAVLEVLQQKIETLEQELRDFSRLAPLAPGPPPSRSALNLEKRSHALRMHRRGEPASQIAAALELPRQEVDLLIKVHRIVLRNI
jgi:hypothetical protein